MSLINKLAFHIIIIIISTSIALCKGNDAYKDKDIIDFTTDIEYPCLKIQRIAIMPYRHLAGKQSNEEVKIAFDHTSEFLKGKGFDVIDASDELKKRKLFIAEEDFSDTRLADIGRALGADAILEGMIVKYGSDVAKEAQIVSIKGKFVYVTTGISVYFAQTERVSEASTGSKVAGVLLFGDTKVSHSQTLKLRSEALHNAVLGMIEPLANKLKEAGVCVHPENYVATIAPKTDTISSAEITNKQIPSIGASTNQPTNIPPKNTWRINFDKMGTTNLTDSAFSPDDTLVAVGTKEGKGAGGNDFWVVKVNLNGDIVWQDTYGGEAKDEASSVFVQSDGSILATGFSRSFGTGDKNIWLIKLDQNGNKLWDKSFGSPSFDESAATIREDGVGGFVIAGSLAKPNDESGDTNAYIVHVSEDGSMIWAKDYGKMKGTTANDIVPLKDGSFMIAGDNCVSRKKYNFSGWVAKVGSDGKLLWEKNIDWNDNTFVTLLSKIVSVDDGFFVLGRAYKHKSTFSTMFDSQIYMAKIDENGTKLSEKDFGISEWDATANKEILFGLSLYDDGYIASGYLTTKDPKSNLDVFLMKFDKSFNLLWEMPVGERDAAELASDAVVIKDSIFVTGSYSTGDNNIAFIMKLNANGEMETD